MPSQTTGPDQRRLLPAVHEVLSALNHIDEIAPLAKRYLTTLVRQVLEEARLKNQPVSVSDVANEVVFLVNDLSKPHYRPIINMTGIILHTNLGRAPLASKAAQYMQTVVSNYSNLEFDLATLKRGKRDQHARRLLRALFASEDALIVNNSAAALFLTLHTLAAGKQTVVSRGELIEIGDSFRLPEIISAAGTQLVEVGTTNRTYVSDFENAVGEKTGAFLRAHPSNYKVVGFSAAPRMDELAKCARIANVPLVYDLGSASPSLATADNVSDLLTAGVDLVLFSGDKLLGGPQAGIIVGRKNLIAKLKRSPIFRTLRLDKSMLASLDWTLTEHFSGMADETLPVQRMIKRSAKQVGKMAEALLNTISAPLKAVGATANIEPSTSSIGGGSLPGESLPTQLIRITFNEQHQLKLLVKALAGQNPAVVGRLENGQLSLDPRSLLEESDVKSAAQAIAIACQGL
jgi:L-seryl-tRNA(Ser) seleniumtransferase